LLTNQTDKLNRVEGMLFNDSKKIEEESLLVLATVGLEIIILD
jgi:hypothetical protein